MMSEYVLKEKESNHKWNLTHNGDETPVRFPYHDLAF